MSARKLGRWVGLVFVLATLLGGAGSAALGATHAADGDQAVQLMTSIDWY